MRKIIIAIGLLLPISAHAQRYISDYPAATSINPTDKILLQQGSRLTPYTYGTVQQIINSIPTLLGAGTIPNSLLTNSTISGIALGGNLLALTFGTHLITGGTTYNGTTAVTITSDATNANTASTIVARDSSGNFSAGTITNVAHVSTGAVPSPANGELLTGASSSGGGIVEGQGTVSDLTLSNKNGTSVCTVATGTTTLNCTALSAPASASNQKQVASPTAPASTSVFAMQGLAGTITPSTTGSVEIVISGTVTSPAGTAAGNGIAYQISYGTGTAPTNAATLTGTQIGSIQKFTNSNTVAAASDVNQPFAIAAIVTGLSPGTAYWIDLAAESIATASDMAVSNVNVMTQESR